jgi:hypothetical protein
MTQGRILLRNLKKDKKAISLAISTSILTAAVVSMLMVALAFANNLLNARVGESEFGASAGASSERGF